MPRARKQDPWNYLCGEKGANRVRVFVHPTGKLFAEYRRDGHKVRQSLGHSDRERAKQEAEELAVALRQPERREAVSLGQLFDSYETHVSCTKSRGCRYHDRSTIERFRRVFGASRRAANLTFRDAARYEVERRREGSQRRQRASADKPLPPLSSRTIAYDLRLLKSVLIWGVGAGLLDHNPLTGYKVEDGGTPRRPVFTETQYRALLEVAEFYPWQFGCLLLLAHESGHRLSAILSLQWRDVDLTRDRVTWRGEADKMGYEHVTPLTAAARQALDNARHHAPGVGEAPVLPGVTNPAKPIGAYLARDWMQRAQVRAGLTLESGRGWHAFRRNFASELRHVGLRDLMDLGGWKDPTTVVKCYQRPSEDAMRAAQAGRRVLEG